jgi:N-acetylglucosamine-6-sulfatase
MNFKAHILKLFNITILLWNGLSSGWLSAQDLEQPDILFILLDDLRYDAMSFMGHPYIKTPNIDKLRDEGMWMQNTFVSTSICCPSRASFLTGAYANRHGVIDNETSEINPDVTPPINQVLKEAGYSTAMIGKWHMGHSGHARPDWDYWLSFDGQGKYFDPEFIIGNERKKVKGYTTDLLTKQTLDYIKAHPKDQPYFVMLSHKAVHEPFRPAPRHKDAYGDKQRDIEPESWSTDFKNKPQWQIRQRVRDVRWDYRTRDFENETLPETIEQESWLSTKKYVDQLRCAASVDDGIGEILTMLEERGTRKNTLIVFASDNGYFHMEHRRWDKRLAMEETMRIPMIISFPNKIASGSTAEQMVMNIDFMPTVLDYANITIPNSVQGMSMRPLLEKKSVTWRDEVFYEYWTELVHTIPTMTALRNERYKIIEYPSIDDLDELYDLKHDPHEMNNLAVLPEYAGLHQSMKKSLASKKEDVGWNEYIFPHNLPNVKGEKGNVWSLHAKTGKLNSSPYSLNKVNVNTVSLQNNEMIFNGKNSYISLPYQHNVDPSIWPLNITLEVRAESDGILVSQATKGYGYCLFIQDGRPGISTHCHTWVSSHTTIDGPHNILGEWTKLEAKIHYNRLSFHINDKLIEDIYLPLPYKAKTHAPTFVGKGGQHVVHKALPNNYFKGRIRALQLKR